MASSLFAVDGIVRDYAWGSPTAIPELLGVRATGAPVAELWFGAHPDDPSPAVIADAADGTRSTLDRLIEVEPEVMLGPEVLAQFGPHLPFLLKVLAAGKALSIQVHPTKAQAQAGFAAEDAAGIERDAPNRNYRDANHKPELLCALTDFDALCGFRPVSQTLRLFQALDVAELAPIAQALTGPDGLRAAFTALLSAPPDVRSELVPAALAGCRRLLSSGGEWLLAARASLLAGRDFPGDIGAVVALLLNAVRLQPGEAIYLSAGNVHAYLRGLGVEIMANSDNVLRCALTSKHVDLAEVLRVADFTPLDEPRLQARQGAPGQRTFPAGVPDFELSILELETSSETCSTGPQLLLCSAGAATARAGTGSVTLSPGRAAFVAAGQAVRIEGAGTLFRATTSGVFQQT